MSREVPKDWPIVAIGSLARVKRGASPRPIKDPKWFSDEGHGWVRISDVTASDRVLRETTQYLSDEGRAASVEIVPGDLIMSICGTIGRPLFSGIHACIHDGFVAFKGIDAARLDPTYLYFVLQAQTRHFEAQSQPGTQRNLNSALVGKTEIPLPPLDEQRRIAEVLRSVDEAIASTEAELRGLRNVAKAAIEERCRTAESDGCLTIGDFATFVGSGVTPKGGKEAYAEQGIAFIRSQNVHFDGLRGEGLAFIDAATDEKMARTRVKAEDVLLNITGASIGRCTIVPKDFGPANVNQHVCIIRPDPAVILPAYLSLFLSSFDGQRQVDQLQGGLSREGLNFQQVRAITVPTPPLEVQAGIAEMMGALRAMMQALGKELAEKEVIKAALMSDLLSGRVRVPA